MRGGTLMRLLVIAAALALAAPAQGQLAPPNAMGISYGHVHLNVKDIELQKKLWVEHFGGTVVHPQRWDPELDYAGQRVVVIGSGATAVTIVPAMAGTAAHVTMLQRSPSYVLPLPVKDPIANGLRRVLPERLAYRITRRINIARQRFIYDLSMRHPRLVRRLIRAINKLQLPAGFDVDTNVVTLFSRDGRDLALPRMSKAEVAQRILDEVVRLRSSSRTAQRSAV